MFGKARGTSARAVSAAAAYLRARSITLRMQQHRCLSELYLASKGKAVEQKEQKVESSRAKPPEQSAILSSIPAPKTYDQNAGELPPLNRAKTDAQSEADTNRDAADSYMHGLHSEQWCADEAWMRFTALPASSYKYLRNIDINCTLARIRGSERGFAHAGRSAPTSKTLNRMLTVYGTATRAGIMPDRYTYQELIAVNVGLMNFKKAREWLEEMVIKGIKPTIRPYRTLLKGYCAIPSEIDSARQLWSEIKQKIAKEEIAASETSEAAAVLDRESYTCIVSAECKVANFERVLDLMHEMNAAGIEADITIRNVILKGVLAQTGLEAGLEELALIKNDGLAPDAFTYNILLSSAIAERRTDVVRDLLTESAKRQIIPSSRVIQSLPLEPLDAVGIMVDSGGLDSIRVYNTLIQAATRQNKFGRALQLISHLRSRNIQPNAATYGLLLDALSKAHKADEAKAVYDEIVQEGVVKPDAHVFSIMVDVCGRSGSIKDMFWFKNEMKKYNLPPSELVYNSILSTLSRLPKVNLRLVMDVVDELVRVRPAIKPTVRTYNAIFAAFAARSRMQQLSSEEHQFLRGWYENTKEKYYVPKDAYMYALAIDAFSGASHLEDALAVYRDMVSHAELDPSVLQKFAQGPNRMLELMRLSVEQQQFDTTLQLWRDWRQLRLPASERAVGFLLFACDQLGHIKTAQDTLRRLLTPSASGQASRAAYPRDQEADLKARHKDRGLQTTQAQADVEDTGGPKLLRLKANLYSPEFVGESALAIYIGLAIKHGIPEDIIPMLRLWKASTDDEGAALSSSSRPQLSGDTRRQLSEQTVAKIYKMLQHADCNDASKISDAFLAFIEDCFPEAMPL